MKLNGIDLDKEHGPVKSAGSVTHRPNNKKYREDRWGCHDKPRPAVYVLESVCVSVCVKMWCTVRALESYLVVNNNLCMRESFVILCVCVFVRHLLTEQEMVNRKVCAPRDWCHSGKHMYSHTCTHTHTHKHISLFRCVWVCLCVCVCSCVDRVSQASPSLDTCPKHCTFMSICHFTRGRRLAAPFTINILALDEKFLWQKT